MKIQILSVFVMLALATASLAQTAPASPAPSAPGSTPAASPETLDKIPPGTLIAAELLKAIDAKKAKAGDKIEAKTSVDLLAHGQIVIPRDSKIVGHIASSKAHSKDSPDSALALAFDTIAMKDGRALPLPAAIQAIGPPLVVARPTNLDPPDVGRSSPAPGAESPSSGGSADAPIGVQNTVAHYPSISNSQSATAQAPSVPVLSPQSHGAVGLKELVLTSSSAASVISSNNKNVHLDSGTQLMLHID